jgi:guanylate kinase
MSNDTRPAGESETDPARRQPAARGNLIVVSGPSGVGKSSLVHRTLAEVELLEFSVSFTTRNARAGEKNEVDYFFVSRDEFIAMRDRGDFLEWAEVHGNLYGTSKSQVETCLGEGRDIILDVDVQGAAQVKERMPDAVTIFILPPSREAVESRLVKRNLNTPEDLERRLADAATEVSMYSRFKYVVVNDDLDRSARALEAIIIAERHQMPRQKDLAESILTTFGGESTYARS